MKLSVLKRIVLYSAAAGLYPLLFYFGNNYSLVNSLRHLSFFVFLFLVLPFVIFILVQLMSTVTLFTKYKKYVFAFVNSIIFLMLLQLCVWAHITIFKSLLIIVLAVLISWSLQKQYLKVVLFQLLLALVAFFWAIEPVIKQLKYNDDWTRLPDDITSVTFVKKPNIYYIQPDGYVNFSEINGDLYKINNNSFKEFLTDRNFSNYSKFRTNYTSTLFSNSSIFSMRHHFYKMNISDVEEPVDAREIIVTKNPVLTAFKNNGYESFILTERPYFFVNKPKLGYDHSNINQDDLSFITTGLTNRADVVTALDRYLQNESPTNKFFFIQIFDPAHITSTMADSQGVEGERLLYKKGIEKSNRKLKQLITLILARDENPMIILMADHGGYVGFEYTRQTQTKITNEDLIYSMYSSILSIRWPEKVTPTIGAEIKSPVNLFRFLFSYLSNNESYIENLEEDASYVRLTEGEEKGVFQYIDGNGVVKIRKQY